MRWLGLLAFVLALGCQGCPAPLPPNPVTPKPVAVDASAACTGSCSCANLCAHGADLGCPWAKPTPAGAPCQTVCENNQAANISPWNLDCRTHAANCNAIDFCQ